MSEETLSIHTREQLRSAFPAALENIPRFESCALLDYPLHDNPGDHMLFIGALLWLSGQCDPARIHITHRLNFSFPKMTEKIGKGPVFFVGGGNLGDLWPNPQRFRESAIASCHDRPAILFPQCMHFEREENLRRAKIVFDAHPELTIMLRDRVSLDLAQNEFQAHTCLAPDQAILLTDIVAPRSPLGGGGMFYLSRGLDNREAVSHLRSFHEAASGIPVSDWECMGFKGMLGGLGVLLSRRGRSPFAGEAFYSRMPETLKQIVAKVDCPGYILRSWQIIDQCITQLDPFAYVITDRFHGHILCTIREITHTVIGNNHHKIRAHWETWSKSFESVTFADSTDSVRNLLANRAVNA